MPVVPNIEMPPTMPRRGFQVFLAISSPSGTEIVMTRSAGRSYCVQISSQILVIIARGTGLMAASPGEMGRPGRRDSTDAFASNKLDAASRRCGNMVEIMRRAMRYIGIITGIFDDARHGITVADRFDRQLEVRNSRPWAG